MKPQEGQWRYAGFGSAMTELMVMILVFVLVIGGLVWSIRALIQRVSHHSEPINKAITQVDQPRQSGSTLPPAPQSRPASAVSPPSTTPIKTPTAALLSPSAAPSPVNQPTPTTTESKPAEILQLPGDWLTLTRRADVTLIPQNVGSLKILVSRVATPFSLAAKGCVPLALLAKPNEALFVLLPSTSLTVQAGTSVQTFIWPMASIDPATFRKPPLEQRLQVLTSPIDGKLTTFMETVSTRTLDWRAIQTGAWILSRNISSPDMDSLRIPITDPMSGKTTIVRLGDYPEIKAVEGILSSLGWDPDSFRIFAEEDAQLKTLLSKIDYSQRGPDYDKLINSEAPARYKGNSQVGRALRDCIQQHARYKTRCRAFSHLATIGLTADPDSLRYMARQQSDRRERFLAAWTLVSSGHDEGLPFLALCASDPSPMVGAQADAAVAYRVADRTTVPRRAQESAFDYWNRTMSTTAYQHEPGLEDEVKKALAWQDSAANQRIKEALEGMASPDESRAASACSQLTEFPRSEPAFKALTRAASKHPSAAIRRQALQNIRGFREFSPVSACVSALDSTDESLKSYAATILCENIFDESIPVLEKALRNKSVYVRRLVAQNAGLVPIPELRSGLVKLARRDDDPSVQQAAAESLCRLHDDEGFKTITSLLRTGERSKKVAAMNLLPIWGFDATALELLKKYQKDADIAEWVARYLADNPAQPTWRNNP